MFRFSTRLFIQTHPCWSVSTSSFHRQNLVNNEETVKSVSLDEGEEEKEEPDKDNVIIG